MSGILGQRLPGLLAGNAHPPPLAAPAVVILDEEIENARAQEGTGVDPILGPLQPAGPEISRSK